MTDEKTESNWTFLTNHAHVLLCLAKSSSMRMRDVAEIVGITERAVQQMVADLDKAGYIDRIKDGRCNVYQIHLNKNLRHPIEAHSKIAGLVSFIHDGPESDLEKQEKQGESS